MKEAVVFMFLLIGTIAQGQTEKIDSICNAYDELIAQAIEEELDFYPPKIIISSTLNKRAIGPVDHTIKLYFDEIEEVEHPIEGEENEYMTYKYAVLRKVVVIFESGSYLIESNYYLDENGFLIKFYFNENGYECYEESAYFEAHQPIRITHTETITEDCPEDDERAISYDKTKLNDEEIATAKLLLEAVEKYHVMLLNQYEIIRY